MKNKRIIKLFKKKEKILQFKLKLGSSETTREAPLTNRVLINRRSFNFDSYLKYKPIHIKNINIPFLEWFIGFSEGDGSFYVRNKNRKDFRLGFDIGQKDPKILYLIKKTLGFGKVCACQNKNTGKISWRYRINTKKNIIRLIHLFNGNFILPKRKIQFNKWVKFCKSWLNSSFNNKQKNIYNGMSVSLCTAWLSGFIDAEGCFYATFAMPSKRSLLSKNLKQKIHITRKSIYKDEKILKQIGKLFFSKANVNPISKNSNIFRLEMSSLKTHQAIVKYLTKFKLKTNKRIAFLRWARVLIARTENEHLNPNRIEKLERLCKSINQN